MRFNERPPLTPQEKSFPSAEYYDHEPGKPAASRLLAALHMKLCSGSMPIKTFARYLESSV